MRVRERTRDEMPAIGDASKYLNPKRCVAFAGNCVTNGTAKGE